MLFTKNSQKKSLIACKTKVRGFEQKLTKTIDTLDTDDITEEEPAGDTNIKAVSLQVIDNYWMEQINVMSHLREGIYLRSYGQEDPLRAYSTEGFDLFDQMLQKIDHDVTIFLLKAEIQKTVERKPVTRNVQTNDDKSDSVKKPKKSKKVGRNDPCPCGSGKKYKQCCGK